MNKKILVLLALVVALLVCMVACADNAGTATGTGTVTGTGEPSTDSSTKDPVDPTTEPDATTEPATTEPGTTESGTIESGTTEPGTTEPGTTTEPATTEPGTTEPSIYTKPVSTTEPATTEPPFTGEAEKPALPTYTPPTDASVYDPSKYPADSTEKYDTSWYTGDKSEYTLTSADQLIGFHYLRSATNTFEGVTIKLGCDMILNAGTVEEILARANDTDETTTVTAWKQLNSSWQFKGTFDGQGHTISGLYMQTTSNAVRGMFGGVGGNAVIKNFTLTNTYYGGPTTGTSKHSIGAIAAKIHENANVTISDVTVSAYMLETNQKFARMGGFVGTVEGNTATDKWNDTLPTTLTLQNCTFNGVISITGNYAGGMIGYVNSPLVTINLINCTNNANICAPEYAGGMIGFIINLDKTTTITNCTNTGAITANKYAGGLVGNLNSNVLNATDCTNTGTITATYAQGDLYGFKSANADSARPTVPTGKSALRVMSFNIQSSLPKTNGVRQDIANNRMTAVKTEIMTYAPDVLGLQEDSKEWITYFDEQLTDYNKIADDTLGSGQERCAIYYKKGMNLVASGYKWLTQDGTSNTVGLNVAEITTEGSKYKIADADLAEFGITKDSSDSILKAKFKYTTSKGEDSTFYILGPRRMTWAIFEINGQYVIYINTHLQHRSQNAEYSTQAYQNIRSMERVKTFDMIQDQLKELKKTYAGAVDFITGDFNDLVGTDIYNAATVDYGYASSHVAAAERYGIDGTWNNAMNVSKQGTNYRTANEGTNGSYLDYCFVSAGIDVLKFRVGAGKATFTGVNGKETTVYTSDHLPIITDLCFGGSN